MKELKLIIFPIILFAFLVGMVFLFTSGTLNTFLPTVAPVDTDGIVEWKQYTFKPADNKNVLTLSYPDNWIIKENAKDESKNILNVSFSKPDGSYFEIIRGSDQGGRCVFKDEPDFNTYTGNGVTFNAYSTYKNGDRFWRLAKFDIASGGWTHALCEKTVDSNGKVTYTSLNSIGIARINIVNAASGREFVAILNKVNIQ